MGTEPRPLTPPQETNYIPSGNPRTLRVQLFLIKKLLEDGTRLLLGA
jgi:hypothetical protein